MLKKCGTLIVKKSVDYNDKMVKALIDAGYTLVLETETTTEKYYIVAEGEDEE